jgi:hypothetical protein
MDDGFRPALLAYLNFITWVPKSEVQKHDRTTPKRGAGDAGTATHETTGVRPSVQKVTLATEVKAPIRIGAETDPVLDLAISVPVFSCPFFLLLLNGGPPTAISPSLLEALNRRPQEIGGMSTGHINKWSSGCVQRKAVVIRSLCVENSRRTCDSLNRRASVQV